MLIFEDGKLVLEGSFTIKAQQTFKYDAGGNITVQSWTLENSACSFVPVEHVPPVEYVQ
jgi:hypothetical protein